MMIERCNCDASCGENRYHDVGSPGCRFADDDEYHAYWDSRRQQSNIPTKAKEINMSKISVKGKLNTVNENFTVNMYDNGFMIEISGRDKKNEYRTSKIMLNSVDEMIEVIKEITAMERDS